MLETMMSACKYYDLTVWPCLTYDDRGDYYYFFLLKLLMP